MAFETVKHQCDLCVIGGGLSGLCAAVAAARHGAGVVLVHERPMLGGNASSEIRMWVSVAHGENNRETGLLEEIMKDNQYRNPDKNYYIWDSNLYEKVLMEKNITLLLNCSCLDAQMEGEQIKWVKGWQMTTQQFHQVEAKIFADCSGDSILAPLTGAGYCQGREGREDFGETIAPQVADDCTMGLSCLIQGVETDEKNTFIPPPWAEKITKDKLLHRQPDLSQVTENFWYLELGGKQDTIRDTEVIREELQALAYGMWDYLKNDPAQKALHENWRLEWVGQLPGKRESRRYQGAYTLTENDILEEGNFLDEVAYGGWTMDDHHPAGFRTKEKPNIFHPAPSPYGIPFGCVYSTQVPNLMFAGRNISVTHGAMSSTRIMGTCALLGQAVGTAAALAVKKQCLPKEVAAEHMENLQQLLQRDDCFLPHHQRKIHPLTAGAHLQGDGEGLENLRDGIDRPRPGNEHAWQGKVGDKITYTFAQPCRPQTIRLVMDSDLNRETLPEQERILKRNLFHNRLKACETSYVPPTMLKGYRVTALLENSETKVLVEETNNYHRLRFYEVEAAGCLGITLEILSTWGNETLRLFAFEVEGESEEV